MPEIKVTEKFLTEVWKRQLLNKNALVTAGGRRLRVIDPGRWNNDSGPDFRDAAFVIDEGGITRGDVEVHVRASDWRCHGHHRDHNYDGVVLHVVMWESSPSSKNISGDGRREVLPLHRCLAKPVAQLQRMIQQETLFRRPCAGDLELLGDNKAADVLKSAGEKRFLLKAEQFDKELARRGPEEVLYEGLLVALGYSKNKAPFRELARRLPLSLLKRKVQGMRTQQRILVIQTLLLGMAGMLPGQRGIAATERWEGKLERTWQRLGVEGSMTMEEWSLFRVRPENLPVRRLAGASYLLERYHQRGLLQGVLSMMGQTEPGRPADLEGGLVVPGDGYWCHHIDFGVATGRNLSLIGRGRARDMVTNVLLPFCFSWARAAGELGLGRHARELYRCYPRQEDNWITRYMGNQIFGEGCPDVVHSACRQQGLIHLYQQFCQRGLCQQCPLR